MTITFTEFIGKAPTLEAIQVTEDNVEELAVWMGADAYSIEKALVGGKRKVEFKQNIKDDRNKGVPHTRPFLFTNIGDWLIKIPEGVEHDGRLYEMDERFRSYEQKDIDNFVKQQHDTGEVDLKKE